jgi:hypothetical protein
LDQILLIVKRAQGMKIHARLVQEDKAFRACVKQLRTAGCISNSELTQTLHPPAMLRLRSIAKEG